MASGKFPARVSEANGRPAMPGAADRDAVLGMTPTPMVTRPARAAIARVGGGPAWCPSATLARGYDYVRRHMSGGDTGAEQAIRR
jgi:hypothetical protein